MKMKTKIITGFFVSVSLLVVISVISILIINSASGGFMDYRQLARDSILIGQLQANMLMMRMNVKDYIINNDDAKLVAYREYLTAMEGFLKDADTEIKNVGRKKNIDEIEQKVVIYENTFQEVISLQNIRNDLVINVLDKNGPLMEKDLTSILLSSNRDKKTNEAYYTALVLRDILLARLYMAKFLDSNEKSHDDRVFAEFGNAETSARTLISLIDIQERRSFFENYNEKFVIYKDGFGKLTSTIYNRNTKIKDTLDVIGPQVASLVETVKLDIKQEQDILGPKLQAQNTTAVIVILAISIVALILAIILALVTTSSILKQLGEDPSVIDTIANRVSMGDLNIDFSTERKKLIGVYGSVSRMVDSLKEKSDNLVAIAGGDLTIDVKKASEVDVLGQSMIRMTTSLNELLFQVNSAIDQVAAGSSQVSQSSQSLSQGASEQASSLEEISSSINEIASQSRQNAQNATEANALARKARDNAENGNRQMAELVSAMQKITESSDEINKVVKVIDDIAFQINLLALNANVEAARAGKYGKGFAVVADEVRNLAVKSAESVKETTLMVEASLKSIDAGNKSAQLTANQLKEIVEGVNRVSDLVEEIASASKEQAQGIEQINQGLEQVDQVTQANTASAEESASAAEELASQGEQLRGMISRFRLKRGDYSSVSTGAGTISRDLLQKLVKEEMKKTDGKALPHQNRNLISGSNAGTKLKIPSDVIKLDDDNYGKF